MEDFEMELTTGKVQQPQCVVIHGPEKVGKSTLASQFPDPVFIDKEDGTTHLDVHRAPSPSSWKMYRDLLAEFAANHHGRQTLVIDSADAIESLCREETCAELQIPSLGGQNDFGNSFNVHAKKFGQSLDDLKRIAKSGMHVVLIGHSQMRKFEEPHQNGAYDRYELQLEKKVCAMVKQWADAIFFLNYKTYVVEDDKTRKKKAKGGQRVIYTTHRPWWDAGNRYGLEDELELKWESVSHCFPPTQQPSKQALSATTQPNAPQPNEQGGGNPDAEEQSTAASRLARTSALQSLRDLMQRDNVSDREVQLAVNKRGYYPLDTPLENYDEDFVSGRLVSHWDLVKKFVDDVRREISG
jgi:hypothetical protein